MAKDIREVNERFERESEVIACVRREISKVIVGQSDLVERLILALLCNGHVLIEGIPGLAKTLSVTTLAKTIDASFHRIQFTPDLLPADLVGTLIYNPKTGQFSTRKGPVFCNIILADEINRAPAKVQSALLEAMQERQVTIGEECFGLDEPFLVLATQNPIEQEGTHVKHSSVLLTVRDGEREGVPAPPRRVTEGDVGHAILWCSLSYIGLDARGDGVRIEERGDARPKLAQHFGAIGFGVVLLHALHVVRRQRRVHVRCRRLPDQHRGLVPPVVTAMEIPQGTALSVR